MIDAQLGEMGWDRSRLDKFLQSPSSPLGKTRRSNPQLRTVKDVNRVLWALRGIAGKKLKENVQA
jgi:cytochrome c2